MAETRVLTLADVSFVEANFSYWSGKAGDRERAWFQRAWYAIIKAGLAYYRTELERCQVAIRCMTLRCIYADFLHLALDDQGEPWLQDDAEALEIKAFQLGFLLSEKDKEWVKDEADEFEFYHQALQILTERERPRLFEALCQEFGSGQGSACDLFVSLWRIARQEPEEEVSHEEILESVGGGPYSEAFSFVVLDGFMCERWY
jgi:hypothetical protein